MAKRSPKRPRSAGDGKVYKWDGKKLANVVTDYQTEARFIRKNLPPNSDDLAVINKIDAILNVVQIATDLLGFCPQPQFRNFVLKDRVGARKSARKTARGRKRTR